MSDEELERHLLPYPDWLHLSPEGHELYAATLLQDLEPAILEVARKRKRIAA